MAGKGLTALITVVIGIGAALLLFYALNKIAAETVQLHGGIAITWEHDAQLVFKRAHALSQLFGQPHQHRALIEL